MEEKIIKKLVTYWECKIAKIECEQYSMILSSFCKSMKSSKYLNFPEKENLLAILDFTLPTDANIEELKGAQILKLLPLSPEIFPSEGKSETSDREIERLYDLLTLNFIDLSKRFDGLAQRQYLEQIADFLCPFPSYSPVIEKDKPPYKREITNPNPALEAGFNYTLAPFYHSRALEIDLLHHHENTRTYVPPALILNRKYPSTEDAICFLTEEDKLVLSNFYKRFKGCLLLQGEESYLLKEDPDHTQLNPFLKMVDKLIYNSLELRSSPRNILSKLSYLETQNRARLTITGETNSALFLFRVIFIVNKNKPEHFIILPLSKQHLNAVTTNPTPLQAQEKFNYLHSPYDFKKSFLLLNQIRLPFFQQLATFLIDNQLERHPLLAKNEAQSYPFIKEIKEKIENSSEVLKNPALLLENLPTEIQPSLNTEASSHYVNAEDKKNQCQDFKKAKNIQDEMIDPYLHKDAQIRFANLCFYLFKNEKLKAILFVLAQYHAKHYLEHKAYLHDLLELIGERILDTKRLSSPLSENIEEILFSLYNRQFISPQAFFTHLQAIEKCLKNEGIDIQLLEKKSIPHSLQAATMENMLANETLINSSILNKDAFVKENMLLEKTVFLTELLKQGIKKGQGRNLIKKSRKKYLIEEGLDYFNEEQESILDSNDLYLEALKITFLERYQTVHQAQKKGLFGTFRKSWLNNNNSHKNFDFPELIEHIQEKPWSRSMQVCKDLAWITAKGQWREDLLNLLQSYYPQCFKATVFSSPAVANALPGKN